MIDCFSLELNIPINVVKTVSSLSLRFPAKIAKMKEMMKIQLSGVSI
jgi:hypothetical protein